MTAKKWNKIFQCIREMNKMLEMYLMNKFEHKLNTDCQIFQRLLKTGPFSNAGEREVEKLISN